uniref:hypothetical protein n=1 Tax=Scandinavium goeteborgense TaxID=1851514 RepID=UPI001356D3AD|nr:hypothetical protein [Scandinavium goeteborgense]
MTQHTVNPEHQAEPDVLDIILGSSRERGPLVELYNFPALLDWIALNVVTPVEDGEPVILSRNHLALLRDDIRNGQLPLPADSLVCSLGNPLSTELQLIALWAAYCTATLDFERDVVFFIATW